MRHQSWILGTILAFLLASATAAAAPVLPAPQPCVEIRVACLDAGFSRAGGKHRSAITRDCIQFILGDRAASADTRPLPAVKPQLVTACRSADPAFGIRTAAVAPKKPERIAGPASPVVKQVITPLPGGLTKPNIVFVLTDDLTMNLLPYMPNVQAMQKEGASFANYFVTNSLCCPSRSSIFTGQFPHNTGVFTNGPEDGGYKIFNAHGKQAETFAMALHNAGYRTAMLGKYLNGYPTRKDGPAPGWDEWDVSGHGAPEYDYDLNQNGYVVHHGEAPNDYMTDVLAGIADQFVRQSAEGPFFIEIATFAPHSPYVPAPRDADRFPGIEVPRTPAYGARPDDNAPRWLKDIPPLGRSEITQIDEDFRKRVQSVQAIDKMIGELRATLAGLGLTDKTYIVFSSDNGYHMGDYSLRPGKMTPFDTDIQVPLIVVGPGVVQNRVLTEIAENIDLCPTFTDLGGGQGPTRPDGRSLVPLLLGASDPSWRQSALIEHHRPDDFDVTDPDAPIPNSANPITYEALRTADALYVEYQDGEIGFYDLTTDPYEMKNLAGSMLEADLEKYRTALAASKLCAGSELCREAQQIDAGRPDNRPVRASAPPIAPESPKG